MPVVYNNGVGSDWGQSVIITSNMVDVSGAEEATLTNSPVEGDPTKWVAINDAGVIRYLPLW